VRNVVLGITVSCALLAGATVEGAVVQQSIGEMAVKARQIAIGDVIDITSYWDDHHEVINSTIVIEVADYLVGAGAGVEVLEARSVMSRCTFRFCPNSRLAIMSC
jgi:hypothetical protein